MKHLSFILLWEVSSVVGVLCLCPERSKLVSTWGYFSYYSSHCAVAPLSNKNVFSDRRNLLYDKSSSLSRDGRLFNSPGPAAANVRLAKVLGMVGMLSSRETYGDSSQKCQNSNSALMCTKLIWLWRLDLFLLGTCEALWFDSISNRTSDSRFDSYWWSDSKFSNRPRCQSSFAKKRLVVVKFAFKVDFESKISVRFMTELK